MLDKEIRGLELKSLTLQASPLLLYLPTGQGICLPEASHSYPVGQTGHSDWPATEDFPSSHTKQAVAPLGSFENFPGSHKMQSSALLWKVTKVSSFFVPGGQAVHDS